MALRGRPMMAARPRQEIVADQHVLAGKKADTPSEADYESIGLRLMGLAQLLARVDGAPGEGLHLDTEAAFLVMTELTEAARRLGVGGLR